MQEHSFLSDLSDNDVVAFEENNLTKLKILRNTLIDCFKNHINDRIYEHLKNQGLKIPQQISIVEPDKEQKTYYNKWLDEGIMCEVLKIGATEWQKGKIRIQVTVEFIADEPEMQKPESPLDEIRQAINQNGQ